MAFPLAINWFGTAATFVVLLIAGGLVAGMVLAIRAVSDDSGKRSELRDLVEALMGTPKHLQPGPGPGQAGQQSESAEAESFRPPSESFTEPCPACGEPVTERDRDCPACGLRLQ